MNLVERDGQLSALEGLLAGCLPGDGKIALVSGPEMTGKTALLDEFARRVRPQVHLLHAAASPAEVNCEFGVVQQLLDSAIVPEHTCAEPFPGPAAKPEAAARRLWDVVRELADERPVVICVDDIHLADAASVYCLSHIARRTARIRVLMVLAGLADPQVASHFRPADLDRHPGNSGISLAPLTAAGVAGLLSAHMDAEVAHHSAPAFVAATGGNPLLVLALIRDSLPFAVDKSAVPRAGESYRQAVRACLHRHHGAVLAVARGIAVLGRPASPWLIGELCDLPVSVVTAAVRTLEQGSILDAGDYHWPTARSAVLDTIAPTDRAALRNRAARLLYEADADLTIVAEQARSGDPQALGWVVPVLEDEAAQALSVDRVDRGIVLLQSAYEICRDERDRARVRSALARARWRSAPAQVRRFLPALTGSARRGRLTGSDLTALTHFLLWHGQPETAREHLPDAARSILRQTYPSTRGESAPQSLPAETERVLQARRLDDLTLLPVLNALLSLLHTARVGEAAAWADLLLSEASARNLRPWRAIAQAVLGLVAVRKGEPEAAHEHAVAALDTMPPADWGAMIGLPLSGAIFGATAMGRYDRAEEYLRIPLPQAGFETPAGLLHRQARGSLYLETDRFRAAQAEFLYVGEVLGRWGLDVPGSFPWRIRLAQAHLGLNEDARAQVLAEQQVARLGPEDSWAHGITLRVMAATVGAAERPARLQEAVDLLQDSDSQLELALAFADLSRAYAALGRAGQARMLGRRAAHLADQCGAGELKRELADTGYEAIGSAAEPRAQLSESELRVAQLAADGYSNRQISGKLFVTVSTVEQHLTRAYRKLGVSRRTDLAAACLPGRAGPSVPSSRSPLSLTGSST